MPVREIFGRSSAQKQGPRNRNQEEQMKILTAVQSLFSPHLCVGFLFLVVDFRPPPSPPLSLHTPLTHTQPTHNLPTYNLLTHHLPTHNLLTRNLLTHHLRTHHLLNSPCYRPRGSSAGKNAFKSTGATGA